MRYLSIIWKESKQIRKSTLPIVPNFAEADSSLAARQGYFPDLNGLTQSVSIFLRDNYTPALPINSPPEAQEEGGCAQTKETHRERRLNRDLFCNFQEFREFRELLL